MFKHPLEKCFLKKKERKEKKEEETQATNKEFLSNISRAAVTELLLPR